MKYSPISFIAIRSGKVRSLIQAVILFGPTDLLIIKAVVRFVLFYLTAFGSEIFSKQWNWNLLENEKVSVFLVSTPPVKI